VIKQRLESVISRISPGVDFDQALAPQFDSLQVAFLLDAIEHEFGIDFPSSELIFLTPLTFKGLEQAVQRRL
jgi:acyl carrier protein